MISTSPLVKCMRSHIILVFLLCSFTGVFAQDTPLAKPLIEVLKELQIRFDYQFNYASDDIDDIRIVPPSRELNLSLIHI